MPGMQKVAARVTASGAPGVSAPDAVPFSVIVRHVGSPKQPAAGAVWSGQSWPVALVAVRVPVVDGEDRPRSCRSSWRLSAGKSRVRPAGFVLVQASSLRFPPGTFQ